MFITKTLLAKTHLAILHVRIIASNHYLFYTNKLMDLIRMYDVISLNLMTLFCYLCTLLYFITISDYSVFYL